MPKRVEHARILLIGSEFDVRKVENAKYEIGDPRRIREFVEYRRKVLRIAVEMIARSGANVVFCEKNIADVAMYYLAMKGILGVRDVERKVMHLLEKATGARIVRNVREVTPEVLGYAGYVEEDKIGMEEIMYVRKCKHAGVASILVRGGNEKFVLELKRQIEDLIDVFAALREHGRVVPGGGAVEGEAAKRLRRFARSVESKEQLAIEAFADALEEIPHAIAANAGMDATYAVLKIREWHHRGKKGYGVDAMRRGMGDAYVKAILDSYEVRRNALSSAVEVACSILRIDDVLIKRPKKKPEKKKKPAEAAPPEYIRRDGKIDLRYAFKGLR
jgi:chaperonin GroEL (HSP60 family)